MSELTTSQLIKIVISVLIFVIVVFAVVLALRNYIIPYFDGYKLQDRPDFSKPYFQQLLVDDNILGVITGDAKEGYLSIKTGEEKKDFILTKYYVRYSNNGVYRSVDVSWGNLFTGGWRDPQVGMIENSVVRINQQYLNDENSLLRVIHGQTKSGEVIRKRI